MLLTVSMKKLMLSVTVDQLVVKARFYKENDSDSR